MDISILTVSFKSPEVTRDCVRSLLDGTSGDLDWELLIGDNGSGDAERLADLEADPRIKLHRGVENLGFGVENNRLAGMARGEFLLCLNPDTIAPPGLLRAFVEHLRSTPACGACGPRLVNKDGSRQFSWNRDMGLGWELAECLYLQNRWRERKERTLLAASPAGPWSVDFTSGAALCIRRSAWERVGGFDPDFFMNHEDIDLCRRIRSTGQAVHVLPGLSVIHLDGETQRKDWSGFVRNRLEAKWIAIGKAFSGPSLVIARVLWAATAGTRLLGTLPLRGPEARQRRRGYSQALARRLFA